MSPDGFIPLNKPTGISSQGAVSRVKRITGSRKAGHTGTLDPLADGLLLVALGRATRLAQYFLEGNKGYRAVIAFGSATDTGDRAGQVIETAGNFFFEPDVILAALAQFVGWTYQRPPAASAIKIKGRRAYSLFRQGLAPEMPLRRVEIQSLTALDLVSVRPTNPYLTIDVECSKGVYIRSLAADIGQTLGCPAHLAQLTRTRVGQLSLRQAADFTDLETDYRPWLLPPAVAVADMPKYAANAAESQQFSHGIALAVPGLVGEIAVFSGAQLLGIARGEENMLKPLKVLV